MLNVTWDGLVPLINPESRVETLFGLAEQTRAVRDV
jgi:hypothetical protein